MTVGELRSVLNAQISLTYYDRFFGKQINETELDWKEQRAFPNRNVYMVYPDTCKDGKVKLKVALY